MNRRQLVGITEISRAALDSGVVSAMFLAKHRRLAPNGTYFRYEQAISRNALASGSRRIHKPDASAFRLMI